jgi:polysaccharide biosynthesis protein PslJ
MAATLLGLQSLECPRSDERERVHTMSRIRMPSLNLVAGGRRSPGSGKRLAGWAAAWVATVAVAAVVGFAAAGHGTIGLALASLVLVFGVFVADPILLVVIVLPGALLVQRVGGASTNLSGSDLLVFVGGVVCLFHVRWKQAPYLRQFLRGVVWYEAVLVLVVIAHPNRYDIVEWFHRFSYLGASVLCGWVIATYGRTRQAFRIFLVASSVLALFAMGNAVTLHFQPAQWGAYQKNTIGAIMWVAIVVAQINPPWAGIGRLGARVTKYLCLGGLLASQSRQAAIEVVLALGVAFLLNPELRRRSKLIALGAVPILLLLYYSFSINARNNPKFNSVSIRVSQLSAAFHVWHLSPLFGEGMRFYDLPQFVSVTAPPNVVFDNLASTGVIGSLAFVFLVFVTVRTMYRLPYALGTLGLAVLIGHYVDGLFDIFWIGGPTVAPYIICGVSLGMADMERTKRAATAPLADVRVTSGPVGRVRSSSGPGSLRAVRLSIREAVFRSARVMARFVPAH